MYPKPFWQMNVYYEKMIFCDFYGLKIWGSCLDVHLFVLEPFCIENNRKTRKNGYFLRYHQKWKLYGIKTPSNWLIMLCWTSGDTLQWFLKFSSFPGRSVGGIYRANRAIFGHFSRFGMNIVGIEYSNSIFDPINDFWITYLDYSIAMKCNFCF